MDWELVLRQNGIEDEIVPTSADNLLVGDPFFRNGIEWVVTKDDGLGEVFPGRVRLICEPASDTTG